MKENSNSLEEVIITADKKETKLQKTPIAVSSISAKEIEQRKMIDMTDLVMTVPNLITMSGGSPTLNTMSIRGIVTFSTDPSIGVNIDGVPMFDGYATSMQLRDIDRIEVLRGPQSTLYGRNALGGVINILTKQPGNTFKGFAEIGMGKFNMQEYRAGISSPIIKDKLVASVNAFYNTREGVYKNEYTGRDFDDYKNYGGNIHLKYLASDRLSFVLNSKLEKNDINGTFPYAANAAYAFENPYSINQNGKNIENRTLSTTSLFAKYQMDNWELTSLTAFNYLDDVYRDYDYDYSPYDFSYWNAPVRPQGTWTQEFKIASQNLGRWDITGGLFGFSDNRKAETYTSYGADATSMYPNAPYTLAIFSEQNGKGFAAFAHITYAISDKWKLTGGLRYDYDEKELTLHDEYIKEPNLTQVFPAKTVDTSNNAISPKLNLGYLAAEDITMYAN
ncbi:TonB-dependent receptor [Flavobacterium collinsii]|uniref:Pesticin receptor n=1 Tax=Flavobacterium collinsii TaxID=1114861 RepID=A0ABN7ER56_9FLAO|nr:TonB-dependent receptor [Flavobacterium collinsii]CAA9203233.1 Pesticin receptor [Flavobacterium collinsii]